MTAPLRGLALALAVTACSAHVDPYIATGELLHVTGQEFVLTAGAFNKGLDDHTVTVEQYQAWAKFAVKFKASYSLAIASWNFATANHDAIEQGKVKDIALALAGELATFTPLVVAIMQPTQPGVTP